MKQNLRDTGTLQKRSFRRDLMYYTPYTFSAKERDLETGYSYFGARYYNATLSVWLSVDPLVEQTFDAYGYTYNNPINYIDPDGRSGESVINEENRIVTIYSKLYFYGEGANTELSRDIATGIASQWNAANAKTTIDGVEYDVKFRIFYETVSEERATELAQNNTSLRNNFIRVEDSGDRSSFAIMSGDVGNSFWFNTNDELATSTTPAHEYSHGLGLRHPREDLSNSKERPHIMIPRGTSYGPYWSIKNEDGRRVVNPNSKRVTQGNVLEALNHNGGRINNIIINKDGRF